MKKIFLSIICLISTMMLSAQTSQGLTGFAGYITQSNPGVTGGGSQGKIIHVTTYADFKSAVAGTTPRIVVLDADITGGGMTDYVDEISIGSNLTIIGSGSGHALNGICLDASGKENIIIRNISLQKGNVDGLSFRNCHHVWVDHCDLADSKDGLLDFTLGSDFLTVSWCKLHNHDKVSITNSGTCHYEDYGREHVTFSHDWFANNVQRNPRIGYGRMHIYNCYWTDISSYCIGFHSQAQVLSEYNYFTASTKNPFCNQYTDVLPYCGYLTDNGSYFANGNPGTSYAHKFTGITYSPATYYDFTFDQEAVANVPTTIQTGVGPQAGLLYEPILCPANGAIQVPVTQKLSWGAIEGATAAKVYFGTSSSDLKETALDAITLQPATTYYWRVTVTVDGADYSSPLYQFTTAGEKTSDPYPADNATDPWLRWPSSANSICTAMPLTWRQAADAKSYRVYLAETEAELDAATTTDAAAFKGETTALSLVPGNLTLGKTYCWRVDAVKADGSVVRGDTWHFSSPKKELKVGRNECEDMYLSGIAFKLNSSVVRGDQGPGAICGIFAGEAGRYAISTTYIDQSEGPQHMAVSVNNKLLDEWITAGTSATTTRQTRQTVNLQPGDEIRVEFVAGYLPGATSTSNEAYCKIDYLTLMSTTAEVLPVERTSGVHHTPVPTKGHDCEYLPIKETLFTDSLGTVGEKGSQQISDAYCSWISKSADGYTVYLKDCVMANFIYQASNGVQTVLSQPLDFNEKNSIGVAASNVNGELTTLCLYKTLPADTLYHTPAVTEGYDCELLWSPDVIFYDSKGTKGVAGKVQMRDVYDQWIKYTNPDGNEVQAKNNSNGIRAYINPTTDAKVAGFVPKGVSGTDYSYVVGTKKSMTYFVQGCSHIKFYYSGTGGASTNLTMTVTKVGAATESGEPSADITADSPREVIAAPDAKGKNVASATVETDLDPAEQYTVSLLATTGDMLVYATKLWPADADGITEVYANDAADADNDAAAPCYNIAGQRVTFAARGIIIRNGKKCMR